VGGPLIPGPGSVLVAVVDSGVYFDSAGNRVPHRDLVGRLTLPRKVNLDLVKSVLVPHNIHNHGTTVTGVIAAIPHNRLNVTGMVQSLPVLPIKISAGSHGSSHLLAEGINLAVKTGAKVLNLSRTVPGADSRGNLLAPLSRALHLAADRGVMVIKSAGNMSGGDVSYANNAMAARFPDVVLVSGLDDTRTPSGELQRYSGSSRTQPGNPPNRQVDIAAPGHHIIGLHAYNGDSGRPGETGTSFGTPHVAAGVGIIWSWTPLGPGESTPQWRDRVLDMLFRGCVRDIGPVGRDDDFGEGSLDMRGRVAFHTAGSQCYSQRVEREPPNDAPPYQRQTHFPGMNPRWAPDRLAMVYDRWDPLRWETELRIQALDPSGTNQGVPSVLGRGTIGMGAFEPKGDWLCFLRKESPPFPAVKLWASRRDGTGMVALTSSPSLLMETPVWSPDGREIVLAQDYAVVRVPVIRDGNGNVTGGGGPVAILSPVWTTTFYGTPAWSADGNRIAFMQQTDLGNGVYRVEIGTVPAGGGTVSMLTDDGLAKGRLGTRNFGPAWTPDGRRIVFHTLDGQWVGGKPQFRHRVRAVPANPPPMGPMTPPTTIHDSGWGPEETPMGLMGSDFPGLSAIDVSRF